MRIFSKEEVPERTEIVGVCHQLMQSLASKFGEEAEQFNLNWVGMFNEGELEKIKEFHEHAKQTVDNQIKTVGKIIRLIEEQEAKITSGEADVDQHLRYSRLVNSMLGYGNLEDPFKTAENDAKKVLDILKRLQGILEDQKTELDSEKGPGQAAYGTKRMKALLMTEYDIFQNIKLFWHEWELVAQKINTVLAPDKEVNEDTLELIKKTIRPYLEKYQGKYSNDGKAAQIGTELAVTLYLNPTIPIKKIGNKVPITLVNIDMTYCNNLDRSHKLGDEMVELGYRKLREVLDRDFPRERIDGKKQDPIKGNGVVTILGRTRYKIIGVSLSEVKKALEKVPKMVMPELKNFAKKLWPKAKYEENAKKLKTTMYGGYCELPVHDELVNKFISIRNQLSDLKKAEQKGQDVKQSLRFAKDQLRKVEEDCAMIVGEMTKRSAAKAEYLEKELAPPIYEQFEEEFAKALEKKEISPLPEPEQEEEYYKIRDKIADRIKPEAVYAGDIDKSWIGRNYIPEQQYNQRMVARINHQIGRDFDLMREFEDVFKKVLKGELDRNALEEAKHKLMQDVLQKRAKAAAYDLRFTKSLNEDAYDDILTTAATIEGPQVWTFFEIDGFNAYNRTYKPDRQDTFYHILLEDMFDLFEQKINSARAEGEKITLRMTKQGDEIWISYPLYPKGGKVTEKQHKEFLQAISDRLVKRKGCLEVENLGTVQFIPYLILDEKNAKDFVTFSLLQGQKVHYVDNTKMYGNFKHKKNMQEGDWEEVTELNKADFVSPGCERLKKALKSNQKEEEFHDWKSFNNGRPLMGTGIFGPKILKFPELLFSELMKRDTENGSERFMTGRVIRLGYTVGYTGFGKIKFRPKDPEAVKNWRKALDEAVENLREYEGRGVIRGVNPHIPAEEKIEITDQ